VLTVTDGSHTAHITLKGDYRAATFVASKDGFGGTDVVAFVSAMAGLAATAGHSVHAGATGLAREFLLAPTAER
jgi:hypothetical protein